MILTITPNTGLDRVLFLPALERNRRNQATEVVESMGGKGCDVSLILRELGEETVATGLAGGDTGRRMEGMLRAAGVIPDFVWTRGQTRFNTVLIETETGDHSTLWADGLRPDEPGLSGLLAWIERWSAAADAVVLAGSLPENWGLEVYQQLLLAAKAAGKPLVVDATSTYLSAAAGLGVAAVKPNLDELASVAGPLPDRAAIFRAAQELQRQGAERVLVSLGEAGGLLVSAGGIWEAPGLSVPVVNPAGAGDGMTACLALAAVRHWDEAETLRWAIAISAAIVTTRGTAEVYRQEIDDLLPRVRVERVA
jgi:tagatose 6-phosphate kinase